MAGNPGDDFESLARRYWAAWGDALRATVPGAGAGAGTGAFPGMGAFPGVGAGGGAFPGTGGPHASAFGAEAWQQSLDWWSRLAHGGRAEANDAMAHFNTQARSWYARMQEVAARFAGQDASAADVARAWKEALGAAGENPFPEMMRTLRGHGLQGLEQWVEDASPWLDAVRGEGLSWLRLPAFGPAREQQERLQALARDLAGYQQASAAYNALLLKAQQEAFTVFESKLADREEPGRQLQSARALFDLWIDAAEEAYADIALSPEFREVYADLANAQMRVRAAVQRMVEDACAQLGMPTRSELDGAHRRLAQLEREVRKLRDAAGRASVREAAGTGAQAQAAARSATRPATKTDSKPTKKPARDDGKPAAKKPATARDERAAGKPANAKRESAARKSAKAGKPVTKKPAKAAVKPPAKQGRR